MVCVDSLSDTKVAVLDSPNNSRGMIEHMETNFQKEKKLNLNRLCNIFYEIRGNITSKFASKENNTK